jgi:hypothetical protein
MLRLVSQFDNEKMRASVATPTCGPCCSCCCCCIVTTLASSIITSRNLGKIVEKQYQDSGLSIDQVKEKRTTARILGFFILPIAIGILWFGFSSGFFEIIINNPISRQLPGGELVSIPVTLGLVYAAIFLLLKKKYKIPLLYILATVVITVALMVGEVFVWINTVFK